MPEIIDAKVGNPQNLTTIKSANLSQPWNLAFFQGQIFQLFFHPYAQRVPKWKIAHTWQSKEPKNTKKTPYNVSVICFQSLTDVLQHPVMWGSVKFSIWLCNYNNSNTGCCKTSVKLWKHITETLYGVFFVFLSSFDCQIWAIFHFGTLWTYGWKKSWKIWPWKKARYQGWLKLANFLIS